jgi:hypothetical protein
MIEPYIYDVLVNDSVLSNIFTDVQPINGKENILPIILYQIFLVDTEDSKNSKVLKEEYILRLHLFSEKYIDVISGVKRLKEMFDNVELFDEDDNVIVNLIRFFGYKDEYDTTSELYNRTIDFKLLIFN